MTASPGRVASAVRAELARRDLSQRQAAARLGLTQQAMSRRCKGQTPFSVRDLLALAAWLDVDVMVLMDEPRVPERKDAHTHQHAPVEAVPA